MAGTRSSLSGWLGSLVHSSTPAPATDFASALLEHLADPVIACDADGTIVMLNRVAREGPSQGEVPTQLQKERWAEYFQLYPLGGRELLATDDLPLVRALGGETVRDEQLESRSEDGARVVLNVSGGPVLDAAGNVQGAVLVMQDVTERIARDTRLRIGNDIATNIALGVCMVSAADGQIVYANEQWERLFGYDPGELRGEHISVVNAATLTSPEARAQEIYDALERDGVWGGEVHNVRKDGSTLWTYATISRFEHPTHGTVWITASADITDRKARDSDLHNTAEQFRTVFENAPVGIALVGEDRQLIDANPLLCEMLGWHRDELVGRPLRAIVHPDDIDSDAELAGRVMNREIPRYRVSKRYMTRAGEVLQVELTSTVVPATDGRPLYSIDLVEPAP